MEQYKIVVLGGQESLWYYGVDLTADYSKELLRRS